MDKIESTLIKAASELLESVQNPDLTREALCRILSLQTFRDLGSESAFIGEIAQNGTLAVTHAFGIQAREIESWRDIPLTSQTPISVSISENKPVWLDLAQNKYELVAGIISSRLNISSSFVTSLPTFTPRPSTHEALSTREANIFQMLGRNKTNAQMANDLDLNDSIVRQDTIHIYRKLGINSRAEARSFYKEHFEKQKDLKSQ